MAVKKSLVVFSNEINVRNVWRLSEKIEREYYKLAIVVIIQVL